MQNSKVLSQKNNNLYGKIMEMYQKDENMIYQKPVNSVILLLRIHSQITKTLILKDIYALLY